MFIVVLFAQDIRERTHVFSSYFRLETKQNQLVELSNSKRFRRSIAVSRFFKLSNISLRLVVLYKSLLHDVLPLDRAPAPVLPNLPRCMRMLLCNEDTGESSCPPLPYY